MKTFYPGYQLEKICKTDRFYIAQISGDALTPFTTFAFDRGDGLGALDALSVSDKPYVIATFRRSQKVDAWVDGGAIQVGAVGIAFIWDEPFRYWCVADLARPNSTYKYNGRGVPIAAGATAELSGSGVDYFAVVAGRVTVNGDDCRVGTVIEVNSDGPYVFTAKGDSVVLKFSETEI